MRVIPPEARVLASSLFFRTWLLKGQVKEGTDELSVLYGGFDKHLAYIKRLMFAHEPEQTDLGRQPAWRAQSLVEQHTCDLALIPAHRRLPDLLRCEPRFIIPWWVSGGVPTNIDYSRAPWKKSLSDEFRKQRKYGYTRVISRDPEDARHYYHSMYLPLVAQAHGDSAELMSRAEVLESMRNGAEIVFTVRDHQRLAGELIIYERGGVCTRALGVLDADRELLRQGVVAASYLNAIEHARENGFDFLNLGGSRAFLEDGLLRYKRKWGLRLTGHDKCGHHLCISELSRGVKMFLRNNPFIYVRGARLRGAVFEDTSVADGPVARLFIEGLSGMDRYALQSSIQPIAVSPEG